MWVSSKSENDRGIDRIKRSILKNEFSEGGLNINDVECLNYLIRIALKIHELGSCHLSDSVRLPLATHYCGTWHRTNCD